MAKQRADWERFSSLLSLLEGCRQNDVPFDPLRWTPPDLRPESKRPLRTPEQAKAEAKAFSGHLGLGQHLRRKG